MQDRAATKKIPPAVIPTYRLDDTLKARRTKVEACDGENARELEISKLKAELSVPVIIQILLELDSKLKTELSKASVNPKHKFSKEAIGATLDVVDQALGIFAESDRILKMNPISKGCYFLTLNKEQALTELASLVTNVRKITVTDETSKLWTEAALWLEGVYQLTERKVKLISHDAKGNPQKILIKGVEYWPTVDPDDEKLFGIKGLTKMQISEFYHGASEIVRKKINNLKAGKSQDLSVLSAAEPAVVTAPEQSAAATQPVKADAAVVAAAKTSAPPVQEAAKPAVEAVKPAAVVAETKPVVAPVAAVEAKPVTAQAAPVTPPAEVKFSHETGGYTEYDWRTREDARNYILEVKVPANEKDKEFLQDVADVLADRLEGSLVSLLKEDLKKTDVSRINNFKGHASRAAMSSLQKAMLANFGVDAIAGNMRYLNGTPTFRSYLTYVGIAKAHDSLARETNAAIKAVISPALKAGLEADGKKVESEAKLFDEYSTAAVMKGIRSGKSINPGEDLFNTLYDTFNKVQGNNSNDKTGLVYPVRKELLIFLERICPRVPDSLYEKPIKGEVKVEMDDNNNCVMRYSVPKEYIESMEVACKLANDMFVDPLQFVMKQSYHSMEGEKDPEQLEIYERALISNFEGALNRFKLSGNQTASFFSFPDTAKVVLNSYLTSRIVAKHSARAYADIAKIDGTREPVIQANVMFNLQRDMFGDWSDHLYPEVRKQLLHQIEQTLPSLAPPCSVVEISKGKDATVAVGAKEAITVDEVPAPQFTLGALRQ